MSDQVDETVENQAEAVQDQVEETVDVQEQVSALLGNSEPIQEEVKEEPKKEEVQEEIQTNQQVPVETIIDKTMIEQYPTLKMYLGKPLSEIPRAYDNLVSAYQKDHKELVKIKNELAKKVPDPKEVPDPIEKPDDFKKWLSEYTEQVKQQAIIDRQNQPEQIDWVAEAKKVIPAENFDEFRQEFLSYNAERFYDKFGELRKDVTDFYDKNPDVLLNEMKKYYNLSSKANKTKEVIQKESKDTAYKTISESLKKAKDHKEDLTGAQFNAVSREVSETEEEQILAKIYKKAQGQ